MLTKLYDIVGVRVLTKLYGGGLGCSPNCMTSWGVRVLTKLYDIMGVRVLTKLYDIMGG